MTEAVPMLPRELTEGLTDEVRNVPAPPHAGVARAVRASSRRPGRRRGNDLGVDAAAPPGRGMGVGLAGVTLAAVLARPAQWQLFPSAVGSLHGEDGGYFEVYRAAKDSIATRYQADLYDIGLHAAIAELTLVNKGLGRLLLPHVVTSVFEAEPRCRRIMFAPDHRNTTARRGCEFAGCTFLGEHDMSNRRMALYALPRSPTDVPAAR